MNQTKNDAYDRITNAKMGSLAGKPSSEYLLKLRSEIMRWYGEIDDAFVTACKRETREAQEAKS